MRIGGHTCAWLLTGCVIAATGTVYALDNRESPYKSIVDRNAFALRPPTPPPQPVDDSAKDAPKITLTGMTDILGLKQVVLKAEIPARPGQTAKEQSYLLGVGDRQDGIEVVAIDEAAGSVKLNVQGVEGPLTLDFQHNGPKPPSGGGPAAAVMAANSAIPGGHPFPGMASVAVPTTQFPGGASFPQPSNSPINNSGGLNANPQMAQSAPAGGPQPTGMQLNWAGNGGQKPADPNEPAVAQYNPGVTGEEQAILIEAQRAQMLEQGSGDMAKLLPPTEFTDEVTKSAGAPPPKGF